MENENDLKNAETNHPAPNEDPGAAIETVTPSTEELVPETPIAEEEEEEIKEESAEPESKEKSSQEISETKGESTDEPADNENKSVEEIEAEGEEVTSGEPTEETETT